MTETGSASDLSYAVLMVVHRLDYHRRFTPLFAHGGPSLGPPSALEGVLTIESVTVVDQGTVVRRRIFGFQRARAEGNGRARRADGVCLSAS